MTFTVRAPITSGTLYAVNDVGGHPPVSIMDFVGKVEFHIVVNGEPYRIAGSGVPGSTQTLRFYEIVDDQGGQDLRIWNVSAMPGAGIVVYQVDGA